MWNRAGRQDRPAFARPLARPSAARHLERRVLSPWVAMTSLVDALVPIAVVAVAVVLLLGLVNMLRGGSPSRSQQLMRARVVLQLLAIVVIMGVIWWRAA
jgi:hypothetical protein